MIQDRIKANEDKASYELFVAEGVNVEAEHALEIKLAAEFVQSWELQLKYEGDFGAYYDSIKRQTRSMEMINLESDTLELVFENNIVSECEF